MRYRLLVAATLVFALCSTNASATAVYQATDGAVAGGYGLWTNQLFGAGGNRFTIGEDGFLVSEYGGLGATFNATATSRQGATAIINFTLSGASSYAVGDDVKRRGFEGSGLTESEENAIISNWQFFDHLSGTIEINDGGTITVYDIVLREGTPRYQQGDYANDKSHDYGASMWLQATARDGSDTGGHWDINVNLTPVPLPAAAWLFGSALLGLFGLRRARSGTLSK